MRKIAVLLNGAGHRDGSEIHEAVLSLMAIEKSGAEARCFALDEAQAQVCNHLSGQTSPENRNMLVESARIARGNIQVLSNYNPSDYDGLMIPGGSGTAHNLCDFATAGVSMTVHPEVARAILSTHQAGRPIAAVCIAPILIAKVLGHLKPRLTLGAATGEGVAAIESWGAVHVATKPGGCVIDSKNLLASTPAYMFSKSTLLELWAGIEKAAAYLKEAT